MDKERFDKAKNFKGIEDKKILAELNTLWYECSLKLLPSTTKRNITINIKHIEELEEELKKYQDKFNVKLTHSFNFLETYKKSFAVSTAPEEESSVLKSVLNCLTATYSKSSVIKLDYEFNFTQIKVIAHDFFKEYEHHPLIFSITKSQKIQGKIIGELDQRKKKIPVAWKTLSKTKDEKEIHGLYLFGERIPKRANIIEEVHGEFFMYRFMSKKGKEFAVLSTDFLRLDDYTIEGLLVEVSDSKVIGDSYPILSKLPIFFVHTATSHVCEIKSHKELFQKIDDLKITGNSLYQYICSYKKNNQIQVLEHPKWFIKLTTSFLFHKKKGKICPFPSHLLWISDRGGGKTTFMEALHQKSGESQEIIAGSTSTVKYLVPSFKETNKPEMGALAKASRLVFVDEFFRILKVNSKDKETECGKMNDLLEHKERLAGSGQGKIRINMTARLLAGTNPIAGTKTMFNLVERLDDAFISRFLVYYQTDDHVKLVHKKKREPETITKQWIEVNDFLSIQDYLQSFDAKYEFQKLVEIFESYLPVMSGDVKGVYEARYLHHLECLMDGIIKTRCLIARDKTFTAAKDDYIDLRKIWSVLIHGWFSQKLDNFLKDESISRYDRFKMLPEESKFILEKLAKLNYEAKASDLKAECRSELNHNQFHDYLYLLTAGGFVIDSYGTLKHAYAEVEKK